MQIPGGGRCVDRTQGSGETDVSKGSKTFDLVQMKFLLHEE